MEIHIITSRGEEHILSVVDGVVVIILPAEADPPNPAAHVEPTPE